jgi:hypothetical protein
MRNFNFMWLLPVASPFAIYGYISLFLAVVGIEIPPDGKGALAIVSLIIGVFGGAGIVFALALEDVEWKWLARKDKSDD